MSANKPDISQLRKYLNGELDAKAMHRLEREAQNDPFLMDALEGYGLTGADQQANLDELQQRLADKVAPKKQRSILLWRVLPIAASLLIAISIGYLLLKPKPQALKTTNIVMLPPPSTQSDKTLRKTDTVIKEIPPQEMIAQNQAPSKRYARSRQNEEVSVNEPGNASMKMVKNDTPIYAANAFATNKTNSNGDLSKKMPGLTVDTKGNLSYQGNQITKVRINGNVFFGNNAGMAVNNLPANAIQSIQLNDGQSNQAARVGYNNNSANSNKILDIKTDTANMQRLGLNNALASRVPGVNTNTGQLNEVAIRGHNAMSKQNVNSSTASIPAIKPDSAFSKTAKIKKPATDSVSYLAEVVVAGYADKNDSPLKPADGWKGYLKYVKQMAVMLDNSVGKVKLAFKIGKDGSAYDIRIIKGNNMAMNQKAIEIVKNGPVWIGGGNGKEVTLKIKFRKGS